MWKLSALLLGALWFSPRSDAQLPGTVTDVTKISTTSGGFLGQLDPFDGFGVSLANIGDLDGDGTSDLAVGALGDDDGGLDRGAVWILFMHPDSSIKSFQKISSLEGGFLGQLDDQDYFGTGVSLLGDLDNDGLFELAVGADCDDDGGSCSGAVWILSLDSNGLVARSQKISSVSGGLVGGPSPGDRFGCSVAAPGDLNNDSVPDLVVGAWDDDVGGVHRGGVYTIFLKPDGTVLQQQKIDSLEGGLPISLEDGDAFGFSVAGIGDLDGDGVGDLLVGVPGAAGGGLERGAVFVLLLKDDGTVKSAQAVYSGSAGFGGVPEDGSGFAMSCAGVGDIDGDGVSDIAIGNNRADDGVLADVGAAWVLTLLPDGQVKCWVKLSNSWSGFPPVLDTGDYFGWGIAILGDPDSDGSIELAIGATGDDDGGPPGLDRGAVWVVSSVGGTPSSVVVENGSGSNPLAYSSVTQPRLGGHWQTSVDLASYGGVASLVTIGHVSVFPIGTGFGELLCWPPFLARQTSFGLHDLVLPCDPVLLGITLCAQGALLEISPLSVTFTNAINFLIGTY